MPNINWTREELILALRLYMQIPFGSMHSRNTKVIALSEVLGRTPSSIAIRLTNYAALDPAQISRGVKGMSGGKSVCQPIWDEFSCNTEELVYESEKIMTSINSSHNITESILDTQQDEKETEGIASLKFRLAQSAFRKEILSNYGCTCAITGIDIDELLIASHIVPWAASSRHRLNPENGVLLSALFDRAFDQGLIAIDTSYTIVLATNLLNQSQKPYFNMFRSVMGKKIKLPNRYPPAKEFLEYHLDTIFMG